MPKFEANMNYTPSSPPCKISYGTTFDNYDPEVISQWCDTFRNF